MTLPARTGPQVTGTALHHAVPRGAISGLLLALPLLLGACSSLFFDEEELTPQRIQVQEQQSADPDYPNLASVPDQAPQPSASTQRQDLVEGLSADRQNARYSDEPLTPESVAAEAAEASDLAYPPPPVLASADDATRSQTAANVPAAPPPPTEGPAMEEPPMEETGALDEPAMPPPPAAAVPSSSAGSEGFTAPPPPIVTAAGESPPEPMAAPAPPSMSDSDGTTYAAPTGLLQEQAFQQQAQAAQRMQQIAAERRAFDDQARQQAIEQQWQREQIIQQQQAQLRYPAAYRQQAALPTTPAVAAAYAPQQAYQAAAVAGQLVGLIYFGHGSAQLDARDQQVLQQVAALQHSQGRGLRVVGHASARIDAPDMAEHEAKNRAMSLRRAEAVARALVAMGADGSRIAIDGAGDAQPVFHEFTNTGEAGNRRVEIFLE